MFGTVNGTGVIPRAHLLRGKSFQNYLLTMIGNRIDVCLISFIIHKPTRHRNCTPVNMCTRKIGTLRR